MRINKTTGEVSHDYIWSGEVLVAEVTSDYILRFIYDDTGNVIGFEHLIAQANDGGEKVYVLDATYYYEKNIFGDVIAIYDHNGTKVASYAFNAYGQCHVLTNHTDDNIGSLNPIRYRSYYIDTDIYLYYLQTRYYDTVTCRFINADGIVSAEQGILGHNMFAYHNNNPVNIIGFATDMQNWIDADIPASKYVFDRYSGFLNNEYKVVIAGIVTSAEERVLNSKTDTYYRGKRVIKWDIGDNAFSFGAMFIGNEVQNRKNAVEVIKHEFGHTLQYDQMGPLAYFFAVGVPSFTIFALSSLDMLPYDYYSFQWEADANVLGGATPPQSKKPPVPQWFNDAYDMYRAVVMKLFPKKIPIHLIWC